MQTEDKSLDQRTRSLPQYTAPTLTLLDAEKTAGGTQADTTEFLHLRPPS